ncbi:MAG: DUF4276 family protein [Verrucomicrobiae bacterium]|nr:DUF4276 family protein [Verrucomicrobiae bacterium]MCB1092733.1 DUF4276 family protein [Verrucomicrobiae bacterium]
MVSAHLYIEGAESKEDQIRCREGFRRLLEKAGFKGRMPRLSACGGRNSAFDDFQTAHRGAKPGHFVAMLIDSEEPVADREQTWDHLATRDGWEKPDGASDEQVLFMTTCMETWIVADRATLTAHYGHRLQENALPPPNDLEARGRADVHANLVHATRGCSNAYQKGRRSFAVVGELNPVTLEELLPSFARAKRILNSKL